MPTRRLLLLGCSLALLLAARVAPAQSEDELLRGLNTTAEVSWRAAAFANDPAYLRILAINDLHGALLPQEVEFADGRQRRVGGAAVLASFINTERAAYPKQSLFLIAGDSIGASPGISRAGNFTSYSSNTSIAGFGNGNNNIGGPSSLNYDARYNNSIRYDSPNFSGLTIATHFAFIGENSTGTKAKGWDTKVDYNNGPITAAIAYARHIDFATYDGNAWVGHAAYDFGVAKVEGQYQRLKYDGNNGSQGSANVRYYHVGVVVPLGPGWLTAQYHNRNKGVTTSATAVTEINNGGGKAYSMSYKFGFSKRTFVYGFGARVKADGCAAIESIVPAYNATTASCAARPAGSSETATAFGFGVQHNF